MNSLVLRAEKKNGVYTTDPETDMWLKPTRETYDALQAAYDHFNWTLFDSALPGCLITLQRTSRSYGYFHHQRFANLDGAPCDEIALNPVHFLSRSVEDTLSTLVHEMVHLWQYHFGRPGRGRYHNRQWAEKMKALGLHPSSTGLPGGAELGDAVSHYIIDGGAFARAAGELTSKGFEIAWREQVLSAVNAPPGSEGNEGKAPPSPKGGKRVKYTCPVCGLNAWAKHDASLLCGEDREPMLPT